MLHLYPPFYSQFQCLADRCPDSCCTGWSVVVDGEAARRFSGVTGELGEHLNRAMTVDEDGDTVFTMAADGRCPFWEQSGLCRIQRELGHEALCETCRKFPRLTQDYGSFVEHGLTLACPEAARLILTHPGPWDTYTRRDHTPEEQTTLDDAFLRELGEAREVLLEELWTEPREVTALGRLLLHGAWYDDLWDGLGREPWTGELPESSLSPEEKTERIRELLRFHRSLEILTPQWAALLDQAIARKEPLPQVSCGRMLHNLATDYLYRYWLQAANDGDCTTKLQVLGANWLTVRTLAQEKLLATGTLIREDWLYLFGLYAKEVEHDDINRQALEEHLWDTPALSVWEMTGLI